MLFRSTAYTIGGGNISANSSYDVRLTITDAFESVTRSEVIPTAAVTMDFRNGGKGVAIGKVSEKDGFEVAWDSTFTKALYAKNLIANIAATINTGRDKVNYWFPVCDIPITSQYGNSTAVVNFTDDGSGNGATLSGKLTIRLKQQSAMGQAPTGSLTLSGSIGMSASNFVMVITENTSTRTLGRVFVKNPRSHSYLIFSPAVKANGAITWYDSVSGLSSLPSGTQIVATDLENSRFLSMSGGTLTGALTVPTLELTGSVFNIGKGGNIFWIKCKHQFIFVKRRY